MTDEQINTKIAELCGWKPQTLCTDYDGNPWPDCPPNYAADLNACHAFEKTLDDKQAGAFHDWLEKVQDCHQQEDCPASQFWYHATARQRCEAFLRVHNQWEKKA